MSVPRPGVQIVRVPDEELTESIHLVAGPNRMFCGAEGGVAVFEVERVTCDACLSLLARRGPS